MGKNIFETLVGAVVLLVALGFVVITYKSGAVDKSGNGYSVVAKFDRVDGLSVGGEVKVSGLTVGVVTKQRIDPETYLAIVEFTINDEVKLPKDSSAEIIGDGLLGGKYLAIVPGGDDKYLQSGDEIQFTQSSVSIESLIGKFMFKGDGKEDSDSEKTAEEDIF